ncbi:MAG: LysM peptidoglycan-binding domain-containing protein [Catenulispora sp.]|nr:LysM peptidoglycan-binding domain-containing protein [Catenulispora sp.]
MRTPHQTSPLGRLREIAVGLLSLLVLLAATFGLPVLLYVVTKGLLPHHTPTTDGVRDLFTKKDNGSTLLGALALVAWLGWAAFALSVLIEVPARLSGRAAIRLPGLGWSQKAATGLLSGIALLIAAGPSLTAAQSAVPHLAPSVVATATTQPTTMTTTAHRTDTGHGSGAHTTTYVVQPGDSLWQIAEDHLGNGNQYSAIAQLNAGRVMPDGSVFHAETFLQPGWTLLVPTAPAAATAPTVPTATAHGALHDTPENLHVVKPGESLSAIAAHDYGDANQWPKIFAANEGAEQNGGRFTDPNLIFPGEKLKIPHLAAPPATPNPGADTHHGPVTPPTDPGHDQHDESAAVAGVAAALHVPERSDVPAALPFQPPTPQGPVAPLQHPGPANPTPVPAPAATASDHNETGMLISFGISGVSAATLLILLAQRRREQQNRRRVGERIAMPAGPAAELERQVRAGADPAGRDFLDRVLRTLAKHSADTGRLIPEVSAAILRAEGVELRLSHPCPPIAPFAAIDDLSWWCSKDQAKLLPRKAAAGQPVPYPALVMMARTDGGEPVLLDLEHYGVVQLGGDQQQAAAAVRSLGVELPWSDYVSVAPAGLALEPALARNPPRHDPPEQVLPALEQWAQAVSSALPEDAGPGTDALRAARIGQSGPGATEPRVLLGTGGWVTPENAERLHTITEQRPRPAAAAVITVDDGVPAAGHRLTLDAAGNTLLHDLNLSVTMQRVDVEQHRRLLSIMSPTSLPSLVEPEWQFSLEEFNRTSAMQPALDRITEPEAAPEAVWIKTLGTLEISGAVTVSDPKLIETAAYIALHPGTGSAALSTDLGITGQAAGTRLAQLRDAFGLDAQGRELLPFAPDGRISFTALVGCDWSGFEQYRRNGRFAEALALVRGAPFADAWPGRYAWAEPYRQAMVSTVIDVAHTLAQAYLSDHEFPSARLAVGRGLLAAPFSELLYRDLMLLVAGQARPDRDEELTALFATFNEVCDEYGVEPAPETVKVMQQLNGMIRVRRPMPGLRTVS